MGKTYVSAQDLLNMGWKSDKITPAMVEDLNKTLVEFNITTQTKIQHFLGQATQECDKGYGLTEYASGRDYEKRSDLGNTNKGDGPKYKGAGAIHMTGRINYQAFADYIGDQKIMDGRDYVADNYPWRSAGFWWKNNNMNERIDTMIQENKSASEMIDEVSRVVNAGPGGRVKDVNGLENRHLYYDRAVANHIGEPKMVIDAVLNANQNEQAASIQATTNQSVLQKIDIGSHNYMPIKLLKDDSIETLAKAFGTTPDKITDNDGNVITGTRAAESFVMVPYTYNWRGISSYTVQEGDNWTKIATRTGISEDKLRTMSGNKGIGDQFDPGISISFFKENSSYHYANGDIVDQSWYAIANHSTQNVQNTSANDSADIRKTQYDNMINDITYSRGDAVEMAKRINYYNETGKLDECRGFGFDVDGKLHELLRDHYSNVKDDIAKGDTTDGVEEKINEYKKNGELKAFKAAGFYVDTDLSIIRNAAHTTNVQNGDERDMRRGGSSSQNPDEIKLADPYNMHANAQGLSEQNAMASLSAKTNTPHKFQSALELMQASIKFTNQCIAAREEQNTQSLGQGQSLGYSRGASRC